jgi:hypothetical protein
LPLLAVGGGVARKATVVRGHTEVHPSRRGPIVQIVRAPCRVVAKGGVVIPP